MTSLVNYDTGQLERALSRAIWLPVSLFCFIVVLFLGCKHFFEIGKDSTDPEGKQRSGLILYKDNKTGIEYLGTKHGGLIRRETK